MTTIHEDFPSPVFSFFVLFCMISEFGLAGHRQWYGKGGPRIYILSGSVFRFSVLYNRSRDLGYTKQSLR
jgi:hypothetical protein